MKKTVVEKHFDLVSKSYDEGKKKYSFYYDSLKKLLHSLIPTNKKVFELGCGTGDLLVSLRPRRGHGQDISSEMVKIAKEKHHVNKKIRFSTVWPKEKFDYIFMSDVIEHLENPIVEFRKVVSLMNDNTRFIITMANPIWEPLLMFWERQGWKMKEGKHSRIKYKKVAGVMKDAGLEIVSHDYKLLIPIKIPLVTNFVNKCLERYLKRLAFIEYFVAMKV